MDARFCYLILRQRNGGNAMAFGERLQEVRKRSGLTQEEFAEQLHVSRQSVSRWESGVSHSFEPPATTLSCTPSQIGRAHV